MDNKIETNALPEDIMDNPSLIKYQSVLERYYTPMYCLNLNDKSIEHHCILFHTNRICLLTIAPSHPIIKSEKTISRINCNVSGDLDRMKNKVSGKGKKGGQKLLSDTVLCEVECTDGSSYKIYSCIKGKLIEINENLINDPNLLVTHTNTNGYIAIILSDLNTVNMSKEEMLSQEKYEENINNL